MFADFLKVLNQPLPPALLKPVVFALLYFGQEPDQLLAIYKGPEPEFVS